MELQLKFYDSFPGLLKLPKKWSCQMLYLLYQLLDINLFHYITFRGIVAFFIGFIFTIGVMPLFIRWAQGRATQPIYELAPENHREKGETPTMGGVIFIGGAVLGTLIAAN
ncbi:MAG: hypothetical protein ABGW77_06865, partial [Campylobacterales bacterium]